MTILLSNKKFQEHLQEIRNPVKNSIRYLKRKQEEAEADKLLKEELKRMEELNAPSKTIR
jgi:hypothetical protein